MKHAGRLIPIIVCMLTLIAAIRCGGFEREASAGSEPEATVTISSGDWIDFIDRTGCWRSAIPRTGPSANKRRSRSLHPSFPRAACRFCPMLPFW